MKAIIVEQDSDGPQLTWQTTDDVLIKPSEVLVAVKATAVNRADLMQAAGGYPPPAGASNILGLEMAGEIVELGADVTGWSVGDRVCALLPGGGYAEYVGVPAGMLIPIPDKWTYQQAAAIPEVWLTAYLNLFHEAGMTTGDVVLLHAAASGVGTAAIQLARLVGAKVIATAGSAEKLARCRELGAHVTINRHEADFLPTVMEATNNRGVDIILDPVGADYFGDNLRALAPQGRLVHIGLLSGGRTDFHIGVLLMKRLRLIGSTLRSRPLPEKVALTSAFQREYWHHFIAGTLQPIVDCTFPLSDAQSAHAYVAQNKNIGKVILALG